MLFYMQKRKVNILTLHINNIQIACLNLFNFLGIKIDKHLTWKKHINVLTSKIFRLEIWVYEQIQTLYTT